MRASTGLKGVTPFKFEAPRERQSAVTINKKGYQPITAVLASIDSRLHPNPVLVRLSPMGNSTPSMILPEDTTWVHAAAAAAPTPAPTVRKPNTPSSKAVPPGARKLDAHGTEYL
ncbi:MAG TPA: hypothetical protein VF585_10615 [Chthoniobacterales bacterium]